METNVCVCLWHCCARSRRRKGESKELISLLNCPFLPCTEEEETEHSNRMEKKKRFIVQLIQFTEYARALCWFLMDGKGKRHPK